MTKLPPIAPNSDEPPRRVAYSELNSVPAVSAIGLIAAKMLHEHRVVTLMVAQDGSVELVPAGELELDLLPEPSALSALISQGYTDQQLESYLRQRSARSLNREAQQALATARKSIIANR